MRVNFRQVFMQLRNPEKPLLDGPEPVLAKGEADNRKPLLLEDVAWNALMAFDPQSKMSGEEKKKRYDLAMRILRSPAEQDYSIEEIALIKKLIGENYAQAIVGPAWEMLEGPGQEKPEGEKIAGAVPAKD